MLYIFIFLEIINSHKDIVNIKNLFEGLTTIPSPCQRNISIFHICIIQKFLKPLSGPSLDEPQSRDQYYDHKGYSVDAQKTAEEITLEGRRPFYAKRHLRHELAAHAQRIPGSSYSPLQHEPQTPY